MSDDLFDCPVCDGLGYIGCDDGSELQIYARVDNEVIDLRLFAQPEAPLAVVEELAQAQVACLESEEACERISVPTELVALAVLATPVSATPIS